MPFPSRWLSCKPLPTSILIVSHRAPAAARWSGVRLSDPAVPWRSTPADSKMLITSLCPFSAAACTAVKPSLARVSPTSHRSRKNRVAPTSPAAAATTSGASPSSPPLSYASSPRRRCVRRCISVSHMVVSVVRCTGSVCSMVRCNGSPLASSRLNTTSKLSPTTAKCSGVHHRASHALTSAELLNKTCVRGKAAPPAASIKGVRPVVRST
mmetsp:Transcript_6868/g.15218  ORF Transcript_6868/g.15218 Transcript_6868/m.15218 type:complete len:211 (+) Transcript_6868:272-904(+)